MSEDKVVNLFIVEPAPPAASDPAIIEKLENLLAQAHAGELYGFGFFTINTRGISTNWASCQDPARADAGRMLAGAAMLNHRVCEVAAGQAE